ncbi:lycopene cyclase [Paucihalobacter ruber]|uniref:Lycopene cyclase n=1 Tax=Paucihalobacter ruber TaxID=2567861 RepID=A0A506PJE2_9FLAO|nr:lycopene cyclase family protein [Paucihalobacter ruber]TPV33911.1 lycopene cyclase [Paucihalobacter ruber]
MKKTDYIITGAGASGLMLAYRMAQDTFFDDKSILIIDKEKNLTNNRTWCFWEQENGEWDDLIFKSWNHIYFGSDYYSEEINIAPYQYKMIRSAKFYRYLWEVIESKPNIQFLSAKVHGFTEMNDFVTVETSEGEVICNKLFNSILFDESFKTQQKFPLLQQHFIGWFVKCDTEVFNDNVATFMDFEIPQNGNTRFMYVLPTSKTEALFEYTLFSKDLLPKQDYENAIKDYLKQKGIENYQITETEHGAIPMTSFKFWKNNTKNVLHIGTAGGWTKASTGYTFMNTTKKTQAVVSYLKGNQDLSRFTRLTKFWFYDLLLLDVLAKHNGDGAKLFSSLFKKTNIKTILKFLDEESNLSEDLRIITAVPPLRFVKALLKRMF